MAKVRQKINEHRYGLIFFGVLSVLYLVYFDFNLTEIGTSFTYSLYVVDYSFGFCSRFLPGAIFNFLCNDISEQKMYFYLNFLMFMTFGVISLLAEKILEKTEKASRDICFWIIICMLVCFNTCYNSALLTGFLDIHWFFAVVTFFVCLSEKKLYAFIPVTFVFSIMVQFYSILNYIPLCILVLLYKIFLCNDKKEKSVLWIITIISGFLSVGILLYMMMFETQNVIGHEEFINRLAERGVTDYEYLEFSFFRTQTGEMFFSNETIQQIKESGKNVIVDLQQENKFLLMIQIIVQQIQIHLMVTDHLYYLPEAIIHIPLILFVIGTLFNCVRGKLYSKQKKFVFVNIILLFFVSLILTLLLATTTIRFVGHSTLVLVIFFAFAVFYDDNYRNYIFGILNKVPKEAMITYIILYNGALYI